MEQKEKVQTEADLKPNQSMEGAGTIEGEEMVPAPFTLTFQPKDGHEWTQEDLEQNAEFAKEFYAQNFTADDLPSMVESVTIKRA